MDAQEPGAGTALGLPAAVGLVQVVRPGVALRPVPTPHDDELALAGGGEVFRLPLAPSAVARHVVLVRALPRLVPLVPVAVAPPRWVGVLADGVTPFTAERRLPGVRPRALDGIARGQLEGVVEALLAVPVREARQWGVPGEGPALLHGRLGARPADPDRPGPTGRGLDVLLADPRTGLLTGVVGWDLRLGDPRETADPALLT